MLVADLSFHFCRGEQAATALEANLSNLESKLDALLAAFETGETGQNADGGAKQGAGDAFENGDGSVGRTTQPASKQSKS